jgi:hypothetical protein
MTAIFKLFYQVFTVWVSAHPNTVVALGLSEAAISMIASHMPMPADTSPRIYKVIFVIATGLAINPARVAASLKQWKSL